MIYVSTACLKRNRISKVLKEYGKNGIKNIELSGGTEYYNNIEADLKRYKKEYYLKYACHAYFPPSKEDFVVNYRFVIFFKHKALVFRNLYLLAVYLFSRVF